MMGGGMMCGGILGYLIGVALLVILVVVILLLIKKIKGK